MKPFLPTVDALPNGVRRGEVKRSSGYRVKGARGGAAVICCNVVRGIHSQYMVQNRTVVGGHPTQVKIWVASSVVARMSACGRAWSSKDKWPVCRWPSAAAGMLPASQRAQQCTALAKECIDAKQSILPAAPIDSSLSSVSVYVTCTDKLPGNPWSPAGLSSASTADCGPVVRTWTAGRYGGHTRSVNQRRQLGSRMLQTETASHHAVPGTAPATRGGCRGCRHHA